MSSPADPGPSAPQEEKEKKGIRGYLSRARTVVKKEGSQLTRRLSRMVSSKSEKKSETAVESKDASKLPEGVTRVSRVQLYEERAKQLGERFGLEIKPSEWHQTEGDALRMEKPIRMRVRRTCHLCEATFGVAKECPSCRHVRCAECIRHPPKRSEQEKEASRARKAAMLKAMQENPPIAVDWRPQTGDFVLKKPRKKDGQDLVYKKPRQRVRRTCHHCQTLYAPGNRKCANCEHVRCTDCPRDPPKKDKYPFGYPGDEFGPSSIPFYGCHHCDAVYPDGNTADGTECRRCNHPKCDKCLRLKPRKVEPEPDPELLRSLQEKIAGLKVG